MLAVVFAALTTCFGSVSDVIAQPRSRVLVTAPSAVAACSVSVTGVLGDKKIDELMRNGFPLRFHMSAELWKAGGIMYQLSAKVEWETVVSFDSFDHTYEVVRVTFDNGVKSTSLGAYKSLSGAQAAAELAFAPPLPEAQRGKRSYIAVQADVQVMEMSDIEELNLWLRGEARPAVQGRKNPGKVLGRGLGSIVTRLLGAEVQHLESRSPTFTRP